MSTETAQPPAEATIPVIPPHQQRVYDEREELDQKREKLREFISVNPIFATLDEAEQLRLRAQHSAMTEYSNILGERIEAFTSPTPA